MYQKKNRFKEDYLAEDQAVPQDTSATGNGGGKVVNESLGSIEIVAEVTEEITIATGTLALTLEGSDDDDTYAAFAVLGTIADDTYAVGTILAQYVVPTGAPKYLRVAMTTTDAAAAGKLSVFPNYLAR